MNPQEESNMEPNNLPDTLANIRHINTYTTPPGYFDNLADEVISKIKLPATEAPFSLPPVQYFDGLADSILQKIKKENAIPVLTEVQKELEETEPLLNSIPKVNVYSVPQGYFDTFSVDLPSIKQPASVVPLRHPAVWIKYAAAAVIAGIIATGAWLFINGNNGASQSLYTFTTNYKQQLANVPDSEISEYLDNPSPDADILSASQDINVTDTKSFLRELLNNVSDKELQNYIKENDKGDEKYIKGI